jgi:hypothetical protein
VGRQVREDCVVAGAAVHRDIELDVWIGGRVLPVHPILAFLRHLPPVVGVGQAGPHGAVGLRA